MSGGVDSSVAAALMLEEGHEVVGITLKQWEEPGGEMPTAGCCTLADAEDARRVAAQLDVPYYVLRYVEEFRNEVVDRFGEAYMAGLTPNPCIECNRRVRFRALLARADELACDALVTGHHARIRDSEAGYRLLTAVDRSKDQSYVLHMLGQRELARVRFPVGEMTKERVRTRAESLGLRTASKPDSQDLCFVARGDYREFLRRHYPRAATPGDIVDTDGRVLGRHQGTVDFTVGQRKGLGIALGEPRYVVGITPASGTVMVGHEADLLVGRCVVREVSFVTGKPPADPSIEVKVRYRATPVPATLRQSSPGDWSVRFASAQPAVAPGQAAVFYRGEEVLGGGTIVTTSV